MAYDPANSSLANRTGTTRSGSRTGNRRKGMRPVPAAGFTARPFRLRFQRLAERRRLPFPFPPHRFHQARQIRNPVFELYDTGT